MRTVFITGAAGGIGEALCRYFEERDYRIIAHARTEEQARVLTLSTERMPVWGDLTDREQVQALALEVISAGPLDLLVHNAGVLSGSTEPGRNGLGIQAEVNVVAPARLTSALATHMSKSADPMVVVVTSSAAKYSRSINYPGLAKPDGSSIFGHYSRSKSAANALVIAMAKAFPKLRVIATEPGFVKTKMTIGNNHLPKPIQKMADWFASSPEKAAHRCFDHLLDQKIDSGSVIQNGKVVNSSRRPWGKEAALEALEKLLAKADAALL